MNTPARNPVPTAREVDSLSREGRPRYSVCTLVTDHGEYREMLASFAAGGFREPGCEFLYIDNSRHNKHDGFSGINRLLAEARGEHVILCHQDVRLLEHGIDQLDRVIAGLTAADPDWGLLGNAGGMSPGRLAIRITDPARITMNLGPFPARVHSLDENFMVVRAATRIGPSRDLDGFHFYGTDLCLQAEVRGYSVYVVDFHLWHLGGASNTDAGRDRREAPARKKVDARSEQFRTSYHATKWRLIDKYTRVLRPRWIQTTGHTLFLSGSHTLNRVLNYRPLLSLARRVGRLWTRLFP